MSATNVDLEAKVGEKLFRGDLYYRLHVVPIEVPGLDARRDDIPELVEHFCADACKKHKLAPLAVSRRALIACQEAPWPGHARQLAHAIEAAVIRAHGEKSSTLHAHHVFPKLEAEAGGEKEPRVPTTLQLATRTFQRDFVRAALERNDWNVTETARQLDLARSHLYNLINDFELQREAGKGRSTNRKD